MGVEAGGGVRVEAGGGAVEAAGDADPNPPAPIVPAGELAATGSGFARNAIAPAIRASTPPIAHM